MIAGRSAQKSLELDRQRWLNSRTRSVIDVGDSSAEEEEEEDPEQPQKKKMNMRQVGRKLMVINCLMAGGRHGVQLRDIMDSISSKFNDKRSEEHEAFLGQVLSSPDLMVKSTEAVRSIYAPLFRAGQAPLDKSALMNVITCVMHHVKVFTVHTCWRHHLAPLKEEMAVTSTKYKSLRSQFQEVRTSYLQEVAALRDEVRLRADLEDGLPNSDIFFMLDPAQMIDPDEQKFLLAAVTEKLKMILERNPKVSHCDGMEQLNKLKHCVENREIEHLRQVLSQKTALLHQAEVALRELQRSNRGGEGPREPGHDKELLENVVSALEDQVQQLQAQRADDRESLRNATKRVEQLEAERGELARGLEEATAQSLQARGEVKQLESVRAEASKKGQEALELQSALAAADEERKALKKTAARRVTKVARQGSQQPPPQFLADAELDFGDGGKARPAWERPLHQLREAEARALEAQAARDAAVLEAAELRGRCEQLQDALQRNAEGLSSMWMEEALKEAEALSDKAEAFGCMGANGAADTEVRECECGNTLMEDASYCRKCGAEWQPQPEKALAAKADVSELARKLKDIEARHAEALALMSSVLCTADDPTGAHAACDPEQLARIVTAKEQVAALASDKVNMEARLLSAQVEEAQAASILQDEDPAPCTCTCAQELRATRMLLIQTKQLCSDLSVKLRQTALASGSVNDALGTAQRTLSKAVEDSPEPSRLRDTVLEVKRQSLFQRLHSNNSRSRMRRDLRMQQLLQDMLRFAYKYRTTSASSFSDLVAPSAAASAAPSRALSPMSAAASARPSFDMSSGPLVMFNPAETGDRQQDTSRRSTADGAALRRHLWNPASGGPQSTAGPPSRPSLLETDMAPEVPVVPGRTPKTSPTRRRRLSGALPDVKAPPSRRVTVEADIQLDVTGRATEPASARAPFHSLPERPSLPEMSDVPASSKGDDGVSPLGSSRRGSLNPVSLPKTPKTPGRAGPRH